MFDEEEKERYIEAIECSPFMMRSLLEDGDL